MVYLKSLSAEGFTKNRRLKRNESRKKQRRREKRQRGDQILSSGCRYVE